MNSQPGKKRKRNPYRDWAKVAFVTVLVMGALWLIFLKAPLNQEFEPLGWGIYWALLLPGVLFFFPMILAEGHNLWPGWMVLGAILNWLLYTQICYLLMRWRRRKRDVASGAPSAPPSDAVEVSYRDRWRS